MAVLQTNELFKTELSRGQHRMSQAEIKQVQAVAYGIMKDVTALCEKLGVWYMLTGGTALGAVRHGGFIPWDDDIDMVVTRADIDRLLDAIGQTYPDTYFVEAPLRTPGYLSSFIQIHKKGTVCREYLSIPRERCGIKIDIFVVENTYDNAFLRKIHGIRTEGGLFLLSCLRMYLWRGEFRALAAGNPVAARRIRFKGAIGRLLAPFGKHLYRRVQLCMRECKDADSRYITVPSGRKHFFGELKERRLFLASENRAFEDREFLFPKNMDWYLSYMYGDYMKIPPEEEREHHVVYELELQDRSKGKDL